MSGTLEDPCFQVQDGHFTTGAYFSLSLDFHGGLRVVLSMFITGIEPSFLAVSNLRELRSCILRVVWTRRHLLANVGAVLSFLDRYLAYLSSEVGSIACCIL